MSLSAAVGLAQAARWEELEEVGGLAGLGILEEALLGLGRYENADVGVGTEDYESLEEDLSEACMDDRNFGTDSGGST